MNLENYVADLNSLAFWQEFTFAQNKFSPRPGKEFELADNLVWLGNYACVLQLKQRAEETDNPITEQSWFLKKVLGKATSQVRDTLRFLEEHEQIRIINKRGHAFDVRCAELEEITKIVVFLGGRALPEVCWKTNHYVNRTAGFIHILAAHDYFGILEKLRVPEDIRRYFAYREEVTPRLRKARISVDEADILGAFIGEENLPSSKSHKILRRLVQDLEDFDISGLIGNLHDHIQRTGQPYEYYSIMLEFARVPRSGWREVMVRFKKSLEAVRTKQFTRPFRLTFPATDCTFMIAPLDPEIIATGPEGEKKRLLGLRNLTHAAIYDAKVSKGVGILISKDGDYVQIDWSLLNMPWKPDREMDRRIAANNPFRETNEKMIDSFLLKTEAERF